jgi:hypothetical protein
MVYRYAGSISANLVKVDFNFLKSGMVVFQYGCIQ